MTYTDPTGMCLVDFPRATQPGELRGCGLDPAFSPRSGRSYEEELAKGLAPLGPLLVVSQADPLPVEEIVIAAAAAGYASYVTCQFYCGDAANGLGSAVDKAWGTFFSSDDEARNPAQDRRLENAEIEKMKELGEDPHEIKEGTGTDIFVGEDGRLYEKPQDGSGPGDFTGLKLKDGKFYFETDIGDIEIPGQ